MIELPARIVANQLIDTHDIGAAQARQYAVIIHAQIDHAALGISERGHLRRQRITSRGAKVSPTTWSLFTSK